jgi:glucose-1-phosphate cytidylyltransferase
LKPLVFILCGGKGQRLRPLTENSPKPLIKIKGKAILDYIIDYITDFKLQDFIIATGYKANLIDEHVKKNYPRKNIITSNAGSVDIIKRILKAKNLIKRDFILLYGDTLSDVNINEMIEFHNNMPGKVTMTLWPFKTQYGLVNVSSEGIVESFIEKPDLNKWINIGYFYFDKKILNDIDKFNKFEDLLDNLVSKGELNGYKHNGAHITVNSIQELEIAEKDIDQL